MAKGLSGQTAVDQLEGIIAPYVRFVADHMALKDWKIAVELDGDLRDSLATIECVPNRQFAVLRIGEDFFDASDEDRRHGIVHELVHLHMESARRAVNTAEPALAPATFQVLRRNHDDQIEGAVDRLADSIARGLPTPRQWHCTEAMGRLKKGKRS